MFYKAFFFIVFQTLDEIKSDTIELSEKAVAWRAVIFISIVQLLNVATFNFEFNLVAYFLIFGLLILTNLVIFIKRDEYKRVIQNFKGDTPSLPYYVVTFIYIIISLILYFARGVF